MLLNLSPGVRRIPTFKALLRYADHIHNFHSYNNELRSWQVAMSKSLVATGPRIDCHPLVAVITVGQQALELLVAQVGGGYHKHPAPGWALFLKNAAL
jgi:hypothetical protein